MRSGIYTITHIATGRVYVGSSMDVACRMRKHRWMLRRGQHDSPHLQRAWNKYGETAFAFAVIEHIEVDALLAREQHWIDTLHATDLHRGYNTAPVAGSRAGVPQPPSHAAYMSKRWRGTTRSAEERARISKANTGKVRSETMKQHLSALAKERNKDPQRRADAAAWAKLAASSKGRKLSDAARANMSEAAKRRAATPEGKARLLRNLNGVSPAAVSPSSSSGSPESFSNG